MDTEGNSEKESSLLRLVPLVFKISRFGSARREFDLTKSQMLLMLALYHYGSVTMKQVSEFISSSKEQATRAVHPLVDRGLVERFELETNRKHVYIRLTESGQKLIKTAVKEYHDETATRIEASLSKKEYARLQKAVCVVDELLSKVE